MSVTYGFYNSLNGDRKYDATQISSIFDGLIIDGVFASIGTCFAVKAKGGLTVDVGTGKAWFNHTWTLNDAILPLEAPPSDVLRDRIDAVVLEVDSSESVRANSIKFVQGTPSSQPVRPTMASSETLHQYPLCYIYRAAGSTEITQADITNMVGTEETPFVTGILQTISIDELLGQWEDEFDQWFNQMKEDLLSEQAFLDQWIASEQTDFLAWFNQIKGQLSTDAAGNLFNLIEAHKADDVHVPSGLISMWSGLVSAIPNGWHLCDGTNGTPDLRDRFIMGAISDADVGETGGQNEVTLTEAQMPVHDHGGITSSAGGHTHKIPLYNADGSTKPLAGGHYAYPQGNADAKTATAGQHSHTISSSGGGQPHENRPAFYKLAFIMKL
jgi:hypothetical protein